MDILLFIVSQVLHVRGKKLVRTFGVHSPFKKLVKSTRFKQHDYVARTIWKTPVMQSSLVRIVSNSNKMECKLLCKKRPSSSVLRTASIQKFEWGAVIDELESRAPTLLTVLKAAANNSSSNVKWPAVVMAAAVLLQSRSKDMCSIQQLISAVLYAGHSSKKV